jgi:ornithine decarboxylase
VGFDVASKVEISTVRELEVDPDKMIFANPVKEINHITFAEGEGIKKMTFDNVDELKKISVFHPNAELVLRILVDDSKSRMPFGTKFGCPTANLPEVFDLAKTLGLNIIGVSFHVGSECESPSAYTDAISLAREVFNTAKTYGFVMRLLDIGGGLVVDAVSVGVYAVQASANARPRSRTFSLKCVAVGTSPATHVRGVVVHVPIGFLS